LSRDHTLKVNRSKTEFEQMKQSYLKALFVSYLTLTLVPQLTIAQVDAKVQHVFPHGTPAYTNITYADDTLKNHLLDIYLPRGAKGNSPLVVWIHGGGWINGDKYAGMDYMQNLLRSLLANGYALASINYRYSTEAVFPAQIRDCNQALEYLYRHAEKYKLDKKRIALMGFSAGGHLASLLALSNNNRITRFSKTSKNLSFNIKAVVDFYGHSDFLAMTRSDASQWDSPKNAVTSLLGASPLHRPDIAKFASPTSYIDKKDPPFLIIHGEKDETVSITQSQLLSSWLTLSKVRNELIIVPGAPHYGKMFDNDNIKNRVLKFLKMYL